MSKAIYCKSCNKYLGEIRDAKLRIGTSYACNDCSYKLEPAENHTKKIKPEEFDNFIKEHGDLLGALEKDPRYTIHRPKE